MSSYNKVTLVGHLTRDPEHRYTPNGMSVASFGLAMNRVWKDDNGEKKEEVTFVDITVWGKTADNCAQFLKKGRQALIEGRLRLEQWDDKQTGAKRSKLTVVGEHVVFLGGPEGGEGAAPAPATRRENNAIRTAPPANAGAQESAPSDDDVPF